MSTNCNNVMFKNKDYLIKHQLSYVSVNFLFKSIVFKSRLWMPSESLEILKSLHQLTYLPSHLLVLRFHLLILSFYLFDFNHRFFEIRVSKYFPELLIGLLLYLLVESPFIKWTQHESEDSNQDEQTTDLTENTHHSLALVGHHSHRLVIDK